ncbi:hypothetical protein [Azotosporobacter soli]|uniref:hypothetical protein n=1 Tax=Azotosporobacter soli TaxID=3055040 RepID=UPI0031FEAFEE
MNRFTTKQSFGAMALGLFAIVYFLFISSASLKGNLKLSGSLAEALLFIPLLLLPVFILFRRRIHLRYPFLLKLTGRLRTWHVPAALLIAAILVAHVYFAYLKGFRVNLRTLSGFLALALMSGMFISGIRQRPNSTLLHRSLALALLVAVLIHA